ncbi:potassium transporter TrkG [Candidatus Poriferisodalis sp.]|uniref:potassium transporter TrkG n=1 Tax=Candidatus Poriferisodalis sp. TaxID=3101277 RepID=UPI003B013CC5
MSGLAVLAKRRFESTPVHISGVALLFVAVGMAVSACVALIDGGGGAFALGASAALTASVGSAMMGSTTASGRADSPLAFASVAWAWLAVSIAGTMPYLFSGVIGWSEADNALFESISGFTCTGATVLADIDGVAHGILFFRSMTQWFGGMGLIVLAVSVLPALKVGGLELIANEAPGPTADRFTPRIAATARRLWMLYGDSPWPWRSPCWQPERACSTPWHTHSPQWQPGASRRTRHRLHSSTRWLSSWCSSSA